jgi:hypothetical protein
LLVRRLRGDRRGPYSAQRNIPIGGLQNSEEREMPQRGHAYPPHSGRDAAGSGQKSQSQWLFQVLSFRIGALNPERKSRRPTLFTGIGGTKIMFR